MDQSLLAVGQLFYTLDGVVQRIAEQRTQVHRIHKIQRRTVCTQVSVMPCCWQYRLLLVRIVSSTSLPVLFCAS